MNLKFKGQGSKFLLVAIIVIAALLRLYQIGTVPPSPDWDEVALGYNAYSILLTGRDEYGQFMPIVLQSFNDYKPALYMYFIVPLIPLFGLDIVSVRLPSAIFGILTVLATYFLIKELFGRKDVAYLTSFLLAISPWHIQFSRVAFETNTGLAFNVFGALFFIKGLRKPWYLFLAALFFGLNLSVYQSDRVFTPLLVLALVIIFWKKLFAIPKKFLVVSVLIGILTILPLANYFVTNENTLSRLKGVSVFSEPTRLKMEGVARYLDDQAIDSPFTGVFHNKWVRYSRDIFSGYLSHYNPNWLFIHGDIARHHAPFMGIMYLWELPFLLIGFYALVFGKFSTKTKILIFAWFFLAPIPAAVTTGVPHSVRTLNFLPTFQIFVALGLIQAFLFIKRNYELRIMNYGLKLFAMGYVLFAVMNFSYYLNQYFVQQNYFFSQDWQYGYREAVSYVSSVENNYKKIVVSNQGPIDQSHMFFLFYLQYSPSEYQQSIKIMEGNHYSFGKFEFRPINWASEEHNSDILYVGRPEDFPPDVSTHKTINYLNGKPAIVIVEG